MKIKLICSLFLFVIFYSLAANAEVKYKLDEIDENDTTILVNLSYRLPYEYVPDNLLTPNTSRQKNKKESHVRLRPEAAEALEKLFEEAKKNGFTLYTVSGYRSYYEQRRLYEDKVEAVGERQARQTVAPQGTSEHQLGLAMDINGESTLKKGLSNDFGESPEGIWITQNAHRFGFIIRYPKDKTDVTGYRWEPWHIRYVGKEAAVDIYTLHCTLEEYTELVEKAGAD